MQIFMVFAEVLVGIKHREDMERRCKELQEQLDQVYATFSST